MDGENRIILNVGGIRWVNFFLIIEVFFSHLFCFINHSTTKVNILRSDKSWPDLCFPLTAKKSRILFIFLIFYEGEKCFFLFLSILCCSSLCLFFFVFLNPIITSSSDNHTNGVFFCKISCETRKKFRKIFFFYLFIFLFLALLLRCTTCVYHLRLFIPLILHIWARSF